MLGVSTTSISLNQGKAIHWDSTIYHIRTIDLLLSLGGIQMIPLIS